MIRLLIFLICLIGLAAPAAKLSPPLVFTETCDASAVVSVTDDLFAVASDEDNFLRFYRWSQPGKPVHTANLNTLFFAKKKSPEMDIEAAARLGQRVFWITSHGRNSKGEAAPERAGLFALEITNVNAEAIVRPVGTIYTNLIADLSREPKLADFRLGDAAKLPPKTKGGLNIEALTATPEGALFIGFRNPIPKGRALIVLLLNPNGVLTGQPAEFGDAITLDLGGLGLRGMKTIRSGYYLLAGPADGGATSQLFFWKGDKSKPQPVAGINFSGINPEGICWVDSGNDSALLVLSDDGSRQMNGEACKDLPKSERQFRAFRVSR